MQQHSRTKLDNNRPMVVYDAARKSVTISFQGQTYALPGTFATYDDGMIAGYAYARAQGWQPA
jgi:hypothetical protein